MRSSPILQRRATSRRCQLHGTNGAFHTNADRCHCRSRHANTRSPTRCGGEHHG